MTTTGGICRLCTRLANNSVKINYVKSLTHSNHHHHMQTRGLKQFQEKTVRLMYWRGRSFDRVDIQKKRSDFQEWNYRSEIFAFSRRLQENLDENTLRQIFTHESYAKDFLQNQKKFNLPDYELQSNQQLIQRGTALLDDCLKPYLRYTFKKVPEEGIVAIADYLKSEKVLADVAIWIGCKDVILSTEYPPSSKTMSDTVLALLAGIEKDLGTKRTQRFVVDMIFSYINDKDILDDVWIIPNPCETLNLILAGNGLSPYEPRIMFQTGVKTIESCHIVGLYSNKQYLGSSPGETLEIAEHCAALNSLQRLFDLQDTREPYVYGEESQKIDYDAHRSKHSTVDSYKIELLA